ncbi:hypothetical protein [Colwellia sp. C1TZA3]|uniref:hypothetical protein n=1 Tax=Colwellia sp. C1TZA3 TaxID=2508879 RepID=UPI0011B9D970|nr:hypothetical protein [Colwellia sp. C1TZA3]TWX72874.1 hypothetical protein ESZ39_06630 [Colwellia sp. C1TZA3]
MLSITLLGTFNDLATHSACQQIEAKVESLNGEAFGILFDCIGYEGSTPDAHKVSNQSLLWLSKKNCIARASIFSQNIYADIVKNEQAALSQLKNQREFTNVQEAKQWLASQL